MKLAEPHHAFRTLGGDFHPSCCNLSGVLVLCQRGMPKMDGCALTRVLRTLSKDGLICRPMQVDARGQCGVILLPHVALVCDIPKCRFPNRIHLEITRNY